MVLVSMRDSGTESELILHPLERAPAEMIGSNLNSFTLCNDYTNSFAHLIEFAKNVPEYRVKHVCSFAVLSTDWSLLRMDLKRKRICEWNCPLIHWQWTLLATVDIDFSTLSTTFKFTYKSKCVWTSSKSETKWKIAICFFSATLTAHIKVTFSNIVDALWRMCANLNTPSVVKWNAHLHYLVVINIEEQWTV